MELQKLSLSIGAIILGGFFFLACQAEKSEEKSTEVKLEAEIADGKFPYRRLSTYGFFSGEINELKPAPGVISYKPASSLFTDYALKTRFVHFPEGVKASITDDELNLPKGTTLIKNFYYPTDFRSPDGERKIIETRLMIHEQKGWEAYPYIWNESQTDAVLKVVGAEIEVKYVDVQGNDQVINYLVPNKNQCKSCHNKSEEMAPIGVKVQHLNNELNFGNGSKNQLAYWTELGKLEGFLGEINHPAMINYEDSNLPLNDRAMAYLDINCAHCHSAEGPASTSGLFLSYDQTDPMKLGINKTPVAAGFGAGKYKFDIVPGEADESIITHRMNSIQVGVAMPELGRTTIHKEGVELIRDWINGLN